MKVSREAHARLSGSKVFDMNDVFKHYELHLKATAEANKSNKPVVFDALAAAGLTRITVDFDGEGDSGCFRRIVPICRDTLMCTDAGFSVQRFRRFGPLAENPAGFGYRKCAFLAHFEGIDSAGLNLSFSARREIFYFGRGPTRNLR